MIDVLCLTFMQLMRSLTSEDIIQIIEDAHSKCEKDEENKGDTMSFHFYPFHALPRQWDFLRSDEASKQFKEQLDRTDLLNDSYII